MRYFVVFLACLLSVNSIAQNTPEQDVMAMSKAIHEGIFDEASTPNYLFPIALADSLLKTAKGSEMESLAEQSLSWYYSYVGEYNRALELDLNSVTPRNLNLEHFAGLGGFTAHSAVAEITKAAAKSDYVLINESHHKPFHRIFTSSLLSTLKAQGYTTLAIESIGSSSSAINESKKIDENLGGLAIEPNYANLIRLALNMGFEILPYDYSTEYQFAQRDSVSALKIIEHKANAPKGKVIVHCGYEHVDKTQKSLAYWLESLSKGKVLSVNQTFFSEEHNTSKESPFYQLALKEYKLKEPFVLKKGKDLYCENTTSDVFVFHPRTKYVDGRPDWYLRFTSPELRFPVTLPVKLLEGISDLTLVQVFTKGEEKDGLPMDQFIIGPDLAAKNTVFLPKGEFIVKASNIERKEVSSAELNVISINEVVFSNVKKK